ncbi:MAG: dihydroorotate dehydrogenase electron transfer subunit [Actinobacteria bacterium]|nr:dihydroorotate dehydrogenase electron transfer subunit [Actinomycetota bacterium]
MIRTRCEILSSKKAGAYHSITLVAPEISEKARPGQFIEVAVPEGRRFFLRRPFWIHQVSRRGGWAGTLEFLFDPRGEGTAWLAEIGAHRLLDVIGPLGRGFAYPKDLTACLLVSVGYGAAPLYFLAEELKARGKRVDMAVGAADQEHVFKPIEGKRLAQTISIVTQDGSFGIRGRVMDVVPEMADKSGAEVVYAAGPRELLRDVAAFCRERSLPAQVGIEERMACGLGLCLTCAVPYQRVDGKGFDNVRACVEGPAMNPARILWDRWMGGEPQMVPTPPEGFPVVRSWPG